jgi:hypothetical protein
VLKGRVRGQHGIVRLDHGAGHLGRRVNSEFELGLFSVVLAEAFKQKRSETGTATTAERVENKEALETRAVVRQAPDAVHGGVNHLFSDGIMTTGV